MDTPIPLPTKPMQLEPPVNTSFRDKLLQNTLLQGLQHGSTSAEEILDLQDEITPLQTTDNFAPITATDKSRLYLPWRYSIIIKVIGRKIGHEVLKQKLTTLWKPSEEISLIDLGADFFLIKFQFEQNMNHALHDGPWFLFNNFLSVQRWEPKFVASKARIACSAIWIRLPELPTEFYDLDILHKIGNKISTLLKIDNCTSSTSRGRYARLCVQVPLEHPLQHHVYIGTHKQLILYEGANSLCTKCGRLGHNTSKCTYTIAHDPDKPVEYSDISKPPDEWEGFEPATTR
ncbi:hypothetical protein P3S68_003939 [Capsicum galapagoense]